MEVNESRLEELAKRSRIAIVKPYFESMLEFVQGYAPTEERIQPNFNRIMNTSTEFGEHNLLALYDAYQALRKEIWKNPIAGNKHPREDTIPEYLFHCVLGENLAFLMFSKSRILKNLIGTEEVPRRKKDLHLKVALNEYSLGVIIPDEEPEYKTRISLLDRSRYNLGQAVYRRIKHRLRLSAALEIAKSKKKHRELRYEDQEELHNILNGVLSVEEELDSGEVGEFWKSIDFIESYNPWIAAHFKECLLRRIKKEK